MEDLFECFACVPASARAARELLARLQEPLAGDDAVLAGLVLSELVTNALRHGCPQLTGTIGVRVVRTPGTLRIEVHQPGPLFDPEVLARSGPPGDGGWGLRLVDRVAREWGGDPEGRYAWADLALTGGGSERSEAGPPKEQRRPQAERHKHDADG